MKNDKYDLSKEKHFQYFSKNLTNMIFQIVEDGINEYYNYETIKKLTLDYHILNEYAQSPIEQIMGSILLFVSDGYNNLDYQEIIGEGENKKFNSYFSCQQKVLDKYRTDFLIRLYVKDSFVEIAIECDGHEFHEKTRQQVSKDKKRDRDFAKNNIIVLRFSGSDIFSHTEECAEEISDFLFQKKEELMISLGLMNPYKKGK